MIPGDYLDNKYERLIHESVQSGTVYYVDNINGDDGNSGTSPEEAWRSLMQVNGTTFMLRDHILFKAGGSWQGQLWPKGSGAVGNPIIIDMYGSGSKPLIAGVVTELQTVFLKNQQYWEINNPEVTNPSPESFTREWKGKRGERCGVYTTRAGGIIFDSVGSWEPCAFHDILIEGAHIPLQWLGRYSVQL